MSNISIYHFENHQIRTIKKDEQFWFIADDVCQSLKLSNVTMALKPLDEDERSKFNLGRQGEVNIINESGMYTLILRCRDAVKKGSAPHRFRKWVTSEVLPTIRKTGSYSLTINEEQQYLIRKAVDERVYRTGEKHQTIYHRFYDQFKITSYKNLPSIKLREAIQFLGGVKINSVQFTDDELCTLAWCYKAGERMRQHIKQVTDSLYQLGSSYAPAFYSMGVEYTRTMEDARIILERETRHIEPRLQVYNTSNWNNVLPNIRQKQIQQF